MLTTPKSKRELFLASSLCDGLEDNDIRQVTTLLFNKEADPNVLLPTHGVTPFHLVIGNDSEAFAEEVTKLFLRHGGNPNVRSSDGLTPVHVAAAWGRINVLELLLVNGGDPLCLDDEGRSPFHYAFDGKYYKAIAILGKYCESDWEKDEEPKYKITFDKVLLNHGDIIAEYVAADEMYKSTNSISQDTDISSISKDGFSPTSRYITLRRHQKHDVHKTNGREYQTCRALGSDYTKFQIDNVVEKERLLISKIINHISSSLSNESINSMLLNYSRNNKYKELRSSTDDSNISYKVNVSRGISNEFDVCKEKRGYCSTKISRKRPSLIPVFKGKTPTNTYKHLSSPSTDFKNICYNSNTTPVARNKKQDEIISLDDSIISKSPNCLIPSRRDKKPSAIGTPGKCNSPVINRNILQELSPNIQERKNSPRSTEIKRSRNQIDQSTPRKQFNKFSTVSTNASCVLIPHKKGTYNGNTVYLDQTFDTNTDSIISLSLETEYRKKANKKTFIHQTALKHKNKYEEIEAIESSVNGEDENETYTGSDDSERDENCKAIHLRNLQNRINIETQNKERGLTTKDIISAHMKENINSDSKKKNYCNEKFRDSSLCESNTQNAIDTEHNQIARRLFNSLKINETNTEETETDNTDNTENKCSSYRTCNSHISIQEEYRYEDPEKGVVLVERRLCVTPSVFEINEESELCSNQDLVSVASSMSDIPKELLLLDNQTLRKKLIELGESPGPVTDTTRRVFLKHLAKTLTDKQKIPKPVIQDGRMRSSKAIHPTLTFSGDWIHDLEKYRQLEKNAFKEFTSPDPSRRWRDGTTKQSFNYLLLDPRITQDLPNRVNHLSESQIWTIFISAVFYVGKGKRNRPYAHLYEAFTYWVSKERVSSKAKEKRILDIWNDGYGVVCLHIFHNTIPVEAFTREAAMIDAVGLEQLVNCKAGEYYGVVATWSKEEKRNFGRYLLYKALQIFLYEGERHLFPQNL